MKQLTQISEGPNYTALDLGDFKDLSDYVFLHPKRMAELKGKVFTGEILKSTGVEISFQSLPPREEIAFLHQHRNHEEIYVFLKGKGEFQVDNKIFEVREGTMVRIAPQGNRSWRNNSDEPLVFMVIQAVAGSLKDYTVFDGFRTEGKPEWGG